MDKNNLLRKSTDLFLSNPRSLSGNSKGVNLLRKSTDKFDENDLGLQRSNKGVKIRVSIGSLASLGLRDIKIDAMPTTLYLMAGEKCIYGCAYCPQSTTSTVSSYEKLSRVVWPSVEWKTLRNAIFKKPQFIKRICFQVVNSENYFEDLMYFVRDLINVEAVPGERTTLPISVSIRPKDIKEIEALFNAGVERVGIPMDTASEPIFTKVRGGNFKQYLKLILSSANEFQGRITTHVIVGLGETDYEIFNAMKLFYAHHITVGLFAFTPIRGTVFERNKPPTLERYRRIQLMRYIFTQGKASSFNFEFDKLGSLVSLSTNISRSGTEALLRTPLIYTTSGCPDCNRPYYNETPAGPMYNYPFVPDKTQNILDAFVESMVDGKIIFRH